jgi:hypothetical protein
MSSTITLQTVVNLASTQVELLPLSGVGGYTSEPALSLCNDVLQTTLAQPLDWKFNRAEMNMLVTSPNRQDYLFAGATIFNIGGNACGAGIDLTTNNALTISGSTVIIKTLEQYAGAVGDVCYVLGTGSNYDSTFSKNGVATGFSGNTYTITTINGLTLTATLTGSASGTSGSAGITDFGWGCGATMVGLLSGGAILPTRHAEVVRDLQPYGYANTPEKFCVYETSTAGVLKIRSYPVCGTGIWGVSLVYQKKAPLATVLSGTWAPIPDELSYVYRQGFLAKCYRYINSPRADVEEQKFQAAIMRALGADEREASDVRLYPGDGIQTSDGNFWLF